MKTQTLVQGLSLRQQVIGHNPANAETQGHQAGAVSFDGQLENAMKSSPGTEIPLDVTRVTPQAAPASQTEPVRIVPPARLETIYTNTQVIFEGQTNRFSVANQIATDAQKFIDIQQAIGKDTSDLDAALANYNAAIASAQTAHDQAQSILNTHAGFSADGYVADQEQAIQTLHSARTYMRQAHNLIASSGRELNATLRAFHQTNYTPTVAVVQS
jgi:flagellar basal body rod protein FlgB